MKVNIILILHFILILGLLHHGFDSAALSYSKHLQDDPSAVSLVQYEYTQKCTRGQKTFYDDKDIKCKSIKQFLEKFPYE